MVERAIACIDSFTDAFNRRDLEGMDAHLHFRHVILSGEKLVVWEQPGQLPASFFEELEATTGWSRTIYHDRRVVLVSPRKVHLLVRYSRNRADESIITMHDNLWIVTEDNGRWGIKERSY
ncbi:conserved hypothetical protein [Paraburkholderia piptadeniae]|uniref:DUF4440 domain-containing protein n=2 Tax=Paraburkholderia piptadeniae TaxID=1701573 RepID=A0A1N7S2P6_9BURK|nr:conserved hypothetical protein [Paraburkholderia piptadeniae]